MKSLNEYTRLADDGKENISFETAYKTLQEAGFTTKEDIKLEDTKEFAILWAVFVAMENWLNEIEDSKETETPK